MVKMDKKINVKLTGLNLPRVKYLRSWLGSQTLEKV